MFSGHGPKPHRTVRLHVTVLSPAAQLGLFLSGQHYRIQVSLLSRVLLCPLVTDWIYCIFNFSIFLLVFSGCWSCTLNVLLIEQWGNYYRSLISSDVWFNDVMLRINDYFFWSFPFLPLLYTDLQTTLSWWGRWINPCAPTLYTCIHVPFCVSLG